MSTITPITPDTAYNVPAAPPAGTAVKGAEPPENIDAVSKDFEAVFLSQMMQAMFEGDDMDQFFGGGTAGDVSKSYLLDAYGKAMAGAGGIGIASVVKEELLKLQETTS